MSMITSQYITTYKAETFLCPKCEKYFTSSEELNEHQPKHDNGHSNDTIQPPVGLQVTSDQADKSTDEPESEGNNNPSNLSPEASSFHMKSTPIETSSVKILDANDESIVEEVEEITVTVCCMCQNISNQW